MNCYLFFLEIKSSTDLLWTLSKIVSQAYSVYGHIDNEKMADIYAGGDIFLNPVTIEAFGQTLVEASACGCVPIALKGSGVKVLLNMSVLAFFARTLPNISNNKKLYQNPELHKLMKKEAIETARQQFSLERQSNTWAKELLNKWGKSFDIPNTSNQRDKMQT